MMLVMETFVVILSVVLVGVALLALVVRRLRRKRHEMSRAGLRRRILEEAESLRSLVDEREMSRPESESSVRGHELSHRRVTLHDEKTRELYIREHLPEVSTLREQLARRGIRDRTLDSLYESAENGNDLRTVSTALSEMARSLR